MVVGHSVFTSPLYVMIKQLDKIKIWIFPSLASLLGLLIWSTVVDIKNDMKFLLTQGTADHVRIDNLERVVFGKTNAMLDGHANTPNVPTTPQSEQIVAVVPNNRLVFTAKKKQP